MCKAREYSLRHWNHVSLVYWKPLLEVSLSNGTDHCTVRVSNPVRNSSDSKLKVCGSYYHVAHYHGGGRQEILSTCIDDLPLPAEQQSS